MFREYYQTELAYLRELGIEFARANPELAVLFSEKGGDPDVERLLEGFAFLSARIRERINDAVPEVVEALAQLLLPHYLRTLPATSIVQFTAHPHALRGRHRVPKGTELSSRPIQATRCLFQTTAAIDLLPLSVERCVLDESSASRPSIRVGFSVADRCVDAVFVQEGLQLYLHGPLPQTSTLFLWFQRHLRTASYVGAQGEPIALDVSRIQAVALQADSGLLPWPETAPQGPRLLQEYFTLPQSLLFLRLEGLERVPMARASERFELVFGFDRPPELPERIETGAFRVNCVPVVNLFDVGADPVRRDDRRAEYLVRASGINPRHMDVYSVNSVIGIRGRGRKRLAYSPFLDFTHAAFPPEQQAYYTLRRARSPIDNMLDTYISFFPPAGQHAEIDDETMSMELTCTNRMLPAELRAGDISRPTPRSPTVAAFSNITGVTVPVSPPSGSELYWRLMAHLALNYRSLIDPQSLRSLLSLYNFQRQTSHQQGRANQLRVDAIRGVEMKPAKHLVAGVPVRGMATTVDVDEAQFASVGDIFLFGCTLDTLFGAQVPINSFNELALRLHPSSAVLIWPPKNGNQPVL